MAFPADRIVSSARYAATLLLAGVGVTVMSGHASAKVALVQQAQPAQAQPAAADTPDGVNGKEHNEFVFVRDSASAQEKFALAQKMERLKEWNKSADLYQEVLEKYRDRVIPDGTDPQGVINRYTSVTWGVLRQLSKWPQDGLDVYRGRYEPKAAELLNSAHADNLAPLYEAFRKYFVTESAKQAGMRLVDANLERGEYAAAAEIGDQLLNSYPAGNLLTERPGLLFRTSLAYALAGDDAESSVKSRDRAAKLAADFPKQMGVVRGKDVILADALKTELAGITKGGAVAAGTTDSWPTFGGGPSRGVISNAKANPGTRLYSLPLAKPTFAAAPNSQIRQQMQAAYDEAGKSGANNGVMPVVDRGDLFFQDGARVYTANLESGVPLTGWMQTHPESGGQYVLKDVPGSTRASQQTLTVTDRYVIAVMGQQDRQAMMMFGMPPQGEARLVCLDRATGREVWKVALSTAPDVPKNEDEKAVRSLALSGAPLVVGDTVLVTGGSTSANQGEDCYVLSFELSTGKFRWACYVASSGMPTNSMYGVPQVTTDSTSHLAYANGRVYCLTNLGAVAALDAYSGTIVWLNIYPLDPPPMVGRGGIQPVFMGAQSSNGSKLKPWQRNPAVLVDGKLFVLPTEGKYLLVYDASSGKEIRRIGLDTIGHWIGTLRGGSRSADRPAALVGVLGNKMVLAGDSSLEMIDWVKFNDETFPGTDFDQVYWHGDYPKPLAGRPFLTDTAAYTADGDKVHRVDLATGRLSDNGDYPPGQRSWDETEGPGNVVVSGDYVVLAGGTNVDVFTDLVLATAKLDHEVSEAPADADPRLRYAEVMFAAGQGDTSLKRLDEAVKLLGGVGKLQTGNSRDRLFSDALNFAVKSVGDERPGAAERVARYFDLAGAAAANAQQQVQYRMARAKYSEQRKDVIASVRLYQEILSDPQTRAVTLLDDQATSPAQAQDIAEKAIAALIHSAGPTVYEKYEQAAVKAQAAAGEEADATARANKLLAVAQAYPNASVASSAMMSAADAFESGSKPREAVRVLRQMWFKYQAGSGRGQILEAIARNYLAVPDRNRGEMAGTAAARLMMAASMPGEPKLSKDLKLPDGTVIAAAGMPISKALEEVRQISGKEAMKSLPDFRIPPQSTSPPWKKPFLPQDASAALPDAVALVLPAREFYRPDRVMTWSPNGVSIFAAERSMPKEPLSRCKAFANQNGIEERPRGVAWSGDTALVWGGSRVISIDAPTGKILWSMDLNQMPQLEIVRGSDAPGVTNPETANGGFGNANGQVFINGRVAGGFRNNVMVVGGRVVQVAQPQQAPAPGVVAVGNINPAQPQQPAAGVAEQVAEVRPVGDRVLVISSTGRIISADLAAGQVNWQTRLAQQTPDRLVATEEFTAVRVSDELSVHLFVLDTFSGRVIGNKGYAKQSNSFPVNMALSAEGTLVYTLPDRLCLRDLYKGWDEEEKTAASGPPGAPPQPIYVGANLPGQLVIAEGRILAIADTGAVSMPGMSSNEKYVRVHSLETGQPLSLRYTADGTHREVDQILTSGSKDWNVTIRAVGARVYVYGPQNIYGYNLDKPSEHWSGSTNSFAVNAPAVNFREAFIGAQHIVLLDQPAATNGGTPQYRLYAFARYAPAANPKKGESGKLDHSVVINDPAGIAPQWQAFDGGFFYATSDGKVRALLGADVAK